LDRFYGLYRGTVVNAADPLGKGRLQVAVPGVLGYGNSWAMISAPFGGSGAGAAVGNTVWVMFEGGNPDYPVVMGKLPVEV
jgi:uncharacterized protein involved in type VI secretion and phage assembly